MIEIDVSKFYQNAAKLSELPEYESSILVIAGEGNDIVLTGAAPIWLYLRIAHTLHGKAKKLVYRSPVTGDVEIFNHDPH